MNKFFLIFAVYVTIAFTFLVVWQQADLSEMGTYYGSEDSLKIARQWIMKDSPTYGFDGFDLETVNTKIGSCFSCFEFTFSFQSQHAGYGNREGEVLAQAITLHTMVVQVRQGEIVLAVTDQKYDEMAGDFLPSDI